MDLIQKFNSDIEKIKKYQRAENAGNYDSKKCCHQITALFERSNSFAGELAGLFADYWIETYIEKSTCPEKEPSEENTEKLLAMHALLNQTQTQEDTKALSDSDWKELCQIVDFNAQDIDLDLLNSLMTAFVDHKAI